MRQLLKVLFIILFIFAFVFVTAKLFFERELNAFLEKFSLKQEAAISRELQIGVAEPLTDLDPASNNAANRERLFNIYEGLVKLDKNLNIIPALAVSYGASDDFTWEFRLRPDVSFHDGSKLSIEDVIKSLNYAWKNPQSRIKDLFANVESISRIDESRLIVKTKVEEPLMLQKIAQAFIFPEKNEKEILKKPVGTGPYIFESMANGELILKRFDSYWGEKPVFPKVRYITLVSRDLRKEAFEKESIDILTDFPPELFSLRQSESMRTVSAETLESNFLLFGTHGIFQNKNLRKAASLALDRNEVAKLGFGFASPISQFSGKGIFGFNPSIKESEVSAEEALEIVSEETEGKGAEASLYLPRGLGALGNYLKERFRIIGITLDLSYVDETALLDIVEKQSADLIFLGWRMELGDTSEFFTSVVHSRSGQYGAFNAGGFSHKEIDKEIEEVQKILKPLERLKRLRELMKKITEEEIIGIPLFSPEALYAVSSKIDFSPRIDGYVFASEISPK